MQSEKVLSLLTVFVAQAQLRSNNRFILLSYKTYSFIVLIMLLIQAVWAHQGKLPVLKEALSWSLDTLISLLATFINLISVSQGLFMKKNLTRLKQFEKYFCETMKVQGEYAQRKRTFLLQLIVLHLVLLMILVLMYFASQPIIEWRHYKYFFVTDFISTYMIAIALMSFRNFIAFLAVDYGIINNRLLIYFDSSNKQGDGSLNLADLPKLDFVRIVQNLHDVLCDCIEGVNRYFGFRILLIVFYTSLAILQKTLLILRLWDFERWKSSLVIATLLLPLTLLVLCFMSASACEQAVKEAKSTSPLSFKLLLEHQPMFNDLSSEEKMIRESLLTLASQALQRKPRFTAAGFFTIDYTMLYSMISTVLTYVVIIIQLIFKN